MQPLDPTAYEKAVRPQKCMFLGQKLVDQKEHQELEIYTKKPMLSSSAGFNLQPFRIHLYIHKSLIQDIIFGRLETLQSR